MAKKCSCGKCHCNAYPEFIPPMRVMEEIEESISGKYGVVSIAWEREEGKVFRYDLPVPRTMSPHATKQVAYVAGSSTCPDPMRW